MLLKVRYFQQENQRKVKESKCWHLLQKLANALAQVKPGNTSEILQNEIRLPKVCFTDQNSKPLRLSIR